MQRRVHKFEYADHPEWMEKKINEKLTRGERIVSTYVMGNYLYVITEDLGLGPTTK